MGIRSFRQPRWIGDLWGLVALRQTHVKPAAGLPQNAIPRAVELFLFQLDFDVQGFAHLRMQNNLDGMFTNLLDRTIRHTDL